MIDHSLLFDHELGSTAFTVERITYIRMRSGTVNHSEIVQVQGCIHPGAPEMIQLLPEEEKNETFIVAYTDYPLSTGTPEDAGASYTAPDRIRWNGQTWRVIKVKDWSTFGFVQAVAIKQSVIVD